MEGAGWVCLVSMWGRDMVMLSVHELCHNSAFPGTQAARPVSEDRASGSGGEEDSEDEDRGRRGKNGKMVSSTQDRREAALQKAARAVPRPSQQVRNPEAPCFS
jgi:hypothetical protein